VPGRPKQFNPVDPSHPPLLPFLLPSLPPGRGDGRPFPIWRLLSPSTIRYPPPSLPPFLPRSVPSYPIPFLPPPLSVVPSLSPSLPPSGSRADGRGARVLPLERGCVQPPRRTFGREQGLPAPSRAGQWRGGRERGRERAGKTRALPGEVARERHLMWVSFRPNTVLPLFIPSLPQSPSLSLPPSFPPSLPPCAGSRHRSRLHTLSSTLQPLLGQCGGREGGGGRAALPPRSAGGMRL
jgi:hypothetical protein